MVEGAAADAEVGAEPKIFFSYFFRSLLDD
jgi:hypothetical protein